MITLAGFIDSIPSCSMWQTIIPIAKIRSSLITIPSIPIWLSVRSKLTFIDEQWISRPKSSNTHCRNISVSLAHIVKRHFLCCGFRCVGHRPSSFFVWSLSETGGVQAERLTWNCKWLNDNRFNFVCFIDRDRVVVNQFLQRKWFGV